MSESVIETGVDLVPVHGGLVELVDRRIPLGERSRFVKEAERLPSVRVTRADLSTVYRISDGVCHPWKVRCAPRCGIAFSTNSASKWAAAVTRGPFRCHFR